VAAKEESMTKPSEALGMMHLVSFKTKTNMEMAEIAMVEVSLAAINKIRGRKRRTTRSQTNQRKMKTRRPIGERMFSSFDKRIH